MSSCVPLCCWLLPMNLSSINKQYVLSTCRAIHPIYIYSCQHVLAPLQLAERIYLVLIMCSFHSGIWGLLWPQVDPRQWVTDFSSRILKSVSLIITYSSTTSCTSGFSRHHLSVIFFPDSWDLFRDQVFTNFSLRQGRTHKICQVGHDISCGTALYLKLYYHLLYR